MADHCTERVSQSFSSYTAPCGNKAKHDPDGQGNPTKCGVHSAAAVARRRAKSDAKYAKYRAEVKKKSDLRNMATEAQCLIRLIADGHNDPRTACAEWVARRNAMDEAP